MNKRQKDQESLSDIKRNRTVSHYAILVFLLLSIALVGGSSVTGVSSGPEQARAIAWAALSGLAVLILAWATFTSYRQSDERQQLVQLKAASLAFMVVLISIFAAEMLYAIYNIQLNLAIEIIFIGGILLWNIFAKVIDRSRL